MGIEFIRKNKKTAVIAISALLGIVLMLAPAGGGKRKEYEKEIRDMTAFKTREEKRLSDFLEEIEGVNEASVIIAYRDSGRKVYGFNFSGNGSEMVIRREGGDELPVEEGELFPGVEGVSVVYTGNPSKKITVARAVSSATGAEIHNVEVVVNEKR